MFLGFAGAAFVVFLLTMRRWHQLNSNDPGSMSRRWLAEHNAQHP